MSHTVNLVENQSVDLTGETVDPRPPDRIGFAAEGVIRMSEGLLERFEGRSLEPLEVEFSLGPSRTVEVDLEEASLRLESIDVGLETPDADDIASGVERVRPSDDGGRPSERPAGTIAFTVEGTIHDVPEPTVEIIAGESPGLVSVTFGVEESARADGGSPSDVLLEVGLFGYGVVVRRDATIEVRAPGAAPDVDLF